MDTRPFQLNDGPAVSDERAGVPGADGAWRVGTRGERIGDEGPLPAVEIRNSFEDDRPALVSLQFYWPD